METDIKTPPGAPGAVDRPAPATHVVTANGGSVAYGPYSEDQAKRVAEELNSGTWQGAYWDAIPVRQNILEAIL